MTAIESLHAHFAALPGNAQVASLFACEGLAWWLDRAMPLRALEVGAGYGTLTAILQCVPVLDAIEDDDHCRKQWMAEITSGFVALWRHGEWRARLGPDPRPYDFVVIDGGPTGPDSDVYFANLARKAVVFFEGRRRPQRARLHAALAGRPFCEAEWRPADRCKGYAVVLCDPCLIERLWFLAVRVREWMRDCRGRLAGRAIGKKARAIT